MASADCVRRMMTMGYNSTEADQMCNMMENEGMTMAEAKAKMKMK